ncbi:hypothetical protein G9P44_000639 [Scheffersomyces stipitis]|nr:hypothetical protein G9P44_000639 [Scheffersomyces stipitis]
MADEVDEAAIVKDEANFDVEDEVQDWKFLNKSLASSGIPKRGEKEFAPDGTQVQNSSLQESRNAMYDALEGVRGHHLKSKLIAVWIASESKCIMPHARGNYFRDMGIPIHIGSKVKDGVELNSLEAVYLVERGSVVIYLGNESYDEFLKSSQESEFDYDSLIAMDLEFLYSVAFNNTGYSLDQYQIYSYLKRLGYLVQDFKQITKTDQRTRLPMVPSTLSVIPSFLNKIMATTVVKYLQSRLRQWGFLSYPLFHSLHFMTKHYFRYTDIYKSLRLIPAYSTHDSVKENLEASGYSITFNVWKPTPSFSKKNPPFPDFQVAVANTDSAKFPTLQTIQALHNSLNYTFPNERKTQVVPAVRQQKKNTMPPSKKEIRQKKQQERQSKLDESVRKKNDYNRKRDNLLKYGSNGRTVVIAVIDSGILNFVNLSEGDFSLQSSTDLEDIFPREDHGIIYNEK